MMQFEWISPGGDKYLLNSSKQIEQELSVVRSALQSNVYDLESSDAGQVDRALEETERLIVNYNNLIRDLMRWNAHVTDQVASIASSTHLYMVDVEKNVSLMSDLRDSWINYSVDELERKYGVSISQSAVLNYLSEFEEIDVSNVQNGADAHAIIKSCPSTNRENLPSGTAMMWTNQAGQTQLINNLIELENKYIETFNQMRKLTEHWLSDGSNVTIPELTTIGLLIDDLSFLKLGFEAWDTHILAIRAEMIAQRAERLKEL